LSNSRDTICGALPDVLPDCLIETLAHCLSEPMYDQSTKTLFIWGEI
jgi:hypothetical protein